MQRLLPLGWSEFFEQQWNQQPWPDQVPARIAAEHRGAYEVWWEHGSGMAHLSGALRHAAPDTGLPAVGDWVAVDGAPDVDNPSLIVRVLERQTAFIRGRAGRQSLPQVVAANVDVVFVVCSLDTDFNLRRMERYLAVTAASGAQAVVVLSKADLSPAPELFAEQVVERCPHVPVVAVSALHGENLSAVHQFIQPGQTVALVGSSGSGKSTLVNAIANTPLMAVGAVRERDGRGCHTTTHRQLIMLPNGGLLLDTPGMREMQLWATDGLDHAFQDVDELAHACHFTNCRHVDEPGCAVRAAVEDGTLAPERLEHFHQLAREAASQELRADERLHRQADRRFGRMVREVGLARRLKRGE